MPLKPCPECGHQVSTAARACPSCGYQATIRINPVAKGVFKFGVLIWKIIAAIILTAVVFACIWVIMTIVRT